MTMSATPIDTAILNVLARGPKSRLEICAQLHIQFRGENSPIDGALQRLRKHQRISFAANKWWLEWTDEEIEEMRKGFVLVSYLGDEVCKIALTQPHTGVLHREALDVRRLLRALQKDGYTVVKDG